MTSGTSSKFPQLVLHYQPQYSADGKRIEAAEALLRMWHPDHGICSAASFLESCNPETADAVDWWILEQACMDAMQFPGIPIGVNVPAEQFRVKEFAPRLLQLIDEIGLPPSRLEIEIVEGSYIENFEAALFNINCLRSKGVKIAIDDFGTGYSSLTYLLKLPVDKLKIDRSFVNGIGFIQSAAIVHAVVALARALGLKITAEGVETAEQHQFLRIAGCHYMQGWLFSPAVGPERLIEMIAETIPGRLTG